MNKRPNKIYKGDIQLAAIVLNDGCIISINHDELLAGTIKLYEAKKQMITKAISLKPTSISNDWKKHNVEYEYRLQKKYAAEFTRRKIKVDYNFEN